MNEKIDKGNVRFGPGGVKMGASSGLRDDQDGAIEEFARRLNEMFPHDISIRFNTNRRGGGAWLVDGKRNAQVGLGADLVAPDWHQKRFEAFREWSKEYDDLSFRDSPDIDNVPIDELELKFSVNMRPPAIDPEVCNKREDDPENRYFYKRFDNLETAWKFFTENVNTGGVNPP